LPAIPLFLVWLLGALLCIVWWRRHPVGSLIALIAFGLFFLQAFIGTCLWYWLDRRYLYEGWSIDESTNARSILSMCRTVVSTIGWILILVALFGWRNIRRPVHDVTAPPMIEGSPSTAIQESFREAKR
jgi:hypothetical protein